MIRAPTMRLLFCMIRQKSVDPVRGKMCELMQVWAHAFRNESSYKIIPDMYNLMKNEGRERGTTQHHCGIRGTGCGEGGLGLDNESG